MNEPLSKTKTDSRTAMQKWSVHGILSDTVATSGSQRKYLHDKCFSVICLVTGSWIIFIICTFLGLHGLWYMFYIY